MEGSDWPTMTPFDRTFRLPATFLAIVRQVLVTAASVRVQHSNALLLASLDSACKPPQQVFTLAAMSTRSTRSSRNFASLTPSPAPTRRRNTLAATPVAAVSRESPSRERRPSLDSGYSSSTDEGGDNLSVASPLLLETPKATRRKPPPGSLTSVRSASTKGSRRSYQSRSSGRGLPLHNQKEIARDIEQFGGLSKVVAGTHSITNFCNTCATTSSEKVTLYGEEKSKRRDSVRNNIQHWRNLGFVEYKEIIESWQILPAAETTLLAAKELKNKPPSFVDIPSNNPQEPQRSKKLPPKSDLLNYREQEEILSDSSDCNQKMSGIAEVASSVGRRNGSGTGTKSDPCK